MTRIQELFSDYAFTITSGVADITCTTGTYDPVWVHKYFESNFDRIDPIFHFAEQFHRRSGSRILRSTEMNSPLFEEAKPHNAASNVMVTDFLGGSTMVLGGVNPDIDERQIPDIMDCVKATHRQVIAKRIHDLTDKQIDLLELSEMGMRDIEIAHELQISNSAIAQRKRAVCKALDITSFQVATQLYTTQKWGGIISG